MYITILEFIVRVSQELLIIFIMDSSLLLLLGKKARWFQLHTIANIYITYKSLPDVYSCIIDPMLCIQEYGIRNPSIITLALHMYHIIAFKKHTKMDYFHHISSAFACTPFAVFKVYDKTINLICFFGCGLPGAINYGLLTAVKYDKLDKLTEKKVSAYLNNFLRMPGLIISCYLMYLNHLYNNTEHKLNLPLTRFFLTMIMFNATFFNYLACVNYGKYLQPPSSISL